MMTAVEPEYACAVVTDRRNWLLLQVRPANARHAANQLTCFGGRRELLETDVRCLHREMGEELNWTPEKPRPYCDLWKQERFIARFFKCDYDGSTLVTEPEHGMVWAPWKALPGLPISPWHREVFIAIAAGRERAEVP